MSRGTQQSLVCPRGLYACLVLVLFVAAGCDDTTSQTNEPVECTSNAECPDRQVCDTFLKLCTLPAAPDVPEFDVQLDTSVPDIAELPEDTTPDTTPIPDVPTDGTECVEGDFRICGSNAGVCEASVQLCEGGVWTECEAQLPEPEKCDGLDNDCDGAIDEMLTQGCGTDVGVCRIGAQSCVNGIWGSCKDDVQPSDETCDGLDNNCDGLVDEGCPCVEGSTQACGSDVGACVAGAQTCTNSVWTACAGEVRATPETCDGLDNDCDGQTDETLSQACGTTDVGECRFGLTTCVAGAWSACQGAQEPKPELCDGKDNDCNGVVDNAVVRTCGNDIGECAAGTQTCSAGVWGTCQGQLGPQAEICDGKDNNCDGQADEGLVVTCGTTDVGECSFGTKACVAGTWGGCVGATEPLQEVCDGKDNNCNGSVDEGLNRGCGVTDVGPCQLGTQTCSAGAWGACQNNVDPKPETCDGVDNNCSGSTDEGLSRSCGSTDLGLCAFGTETCSAGGWGGCDAVEPGIEVCEGMVDENCDGNVDEGCICTPGETRSCGVTEVGPCALGVQTCEGTASAPNWGACVGNVDPKPELCDGNDNNCDGIIDGITLPCGSTNVGVCALGVETCFGGVWTTCDAVEPGIEVCDGSLDENCDGNVDEGCACVNFSTRPCGTNVGACVAGVETCTSGQWGACTGAQGPSAEVCNDLDDDCNSIVDDIPVGSCNNPPVAICPANVTDAVPLQTVTLDGTSSSDPDADPLDYIWTVIAAPSGSTSDPTPADGDTADFYLDLAGNYTVELTVSDGEFSDSCQLNITVIPPQHLHVQLIWEDDDGDLDLHLTRANVPPLGAFFDNAVGGTGDDCWWVDTQRVTSWGATLDIDDTNGFGPENINIAANPTNGVYNIGAQLYCDQGISATNALVGTSGPKRARARIYCNGTLVREIPSATGWRQLDVSNDFWHVAEVNWTGTGPTGCQVTVKDTVEGAVKYYTAAGLRGYQNAALDCGNHRQGCAVHTDCRTFESCYALQGGGKPTTECRLNELCNSAADCTNSARPYCPSKYKVCSRTP